ncbi:hypothetical protein [Deinococcus sp. Leaf326]|uniref:hypothetical protein n=1 Tax=Deinococcus sp. Leaf326 TaxID=1736338 RepID=UPI00070046C4|nr:hypothetical protein [Deinococcus sp. Leaf326]KQR33105.1 hypothetical protein ASF71_16570 [Deinococcus sp. Leaf326]
MNLTTTRTWNLTLLVRECGVVTGTAEYTVTLYRVGADLAGIVNGEPDTATRVILLLEAAEHLEPVAEEQVEVIGNAVACELHKTLGRLKFKDHYATAAEALGRSVRSLARLTADEAATVRSYAYGQWGMVG